MLPVIAAISASLIYISTEALKNKEVSYNKLFSIFLFSLVSSFLSISAFTYLYENIDWGSTLLMLYSLIYACTQISEGELSTIILQMNSGGNNNNNNTNNTLPPINTSANVTQ